MATANTVLPPMATISMIGIWIETVLYGMSDVVFVVYFLLILAFSQVSSRSKTPSGCNEPSDDTNELVVASCTDYACSFSCVKARPRLYVGGFKAIPYWHDYHITDDMRLVGCS